ncbi:Regulator of nucleoside diphosphate kinase [compost metagenome]
MNNLPGIFITDQDFHRLSALVEQIEGATATALDEELSRANVIAQKEIPPDIVTMNSRLKFVDEVSGQESEMTLVYPQEANLAEGRISILAPVGVALLGLKAGQSIDWQLPSGGKKRIKVQQIVFQPEAEGKWEL